MFNSVMNSAILLWFLKFYVSMHLKRKKVGGEIVEDDVAVSAHKDKES